MLSFFVSLFRNWEFCRNSRAWFGKKFKVHTFVAAYFYIHKISHFEFAYVFFNLDAIENFNWIVKRQFANQDTCFCFETWLLVEKVGVGIRIFVHVKMSRSSAVRFRTLPLRIRSLIPSVVANFASAYIYIYIPTFKNCLVLIFMFVLSSKKINK